MDIILGIILVVCGLVVTLAGLRVFFIALPIIGFFAGFFIGSIGLQSLFGQGFLSTVSSWIVGLVVGLVFALVSYLWWYAGALVAAGAVGASLGTGLLHLFNVDVGFLLFLFGLIGFVLFVVGALLLNLPVYIVIVNTAFAGALLTIAGVLLVFNQIQSVDLGSGASVALIDGNWFWALLWIVLAAVGIVAQINMVDQVDLPDEKWVPATAA